MRSVSALTALILVALAGGCGSDDPAAAPPPNPTQNTSDPEVLAACRNFAERLCAGAESCCVDTVGSFSSDGCVSGVIGDFCEPAAQLVAAERATYDQTAEDACLAAHARSHEGCVPDWEEILSLRREVWSACKVVSGTVRPGGTCSTSSMCALPDGVGTSVCTMGVCRELRLLASGDECAYPLGDVSVCDTGLYCTAMERDEIGTCEPATAEGEPCEPVKLNPACGLGSYCDLDSGVCRKATNFGGPSCQQGPECVSFICDEVASTCRPATSTVGGLCAEAT